MSFIVIQLFGFFGWLLLLFSYWKKNITGVLFLQVISGIFYCLHYYFLGAYTGFFIVLFELFRDFSYYKTKYDRYIFIFTLPIYVFFIFFKYTGFFSLLPCIASIIDGYTLAINKKVALIGSIISFSLWLIYDSFSRSYVGVLMGTIMIISNVLSLLKTRENN